MTMLVCRICKKLIMYAVDGCCEECVRQPATDETQESEESAQEQLAA